MPEGLYEEVNERIAAVNGETDSNPMAEGDEMVLSGVSDDAALIEGDSKAFQFDENEDDEHTSEDELLQIMDDIAEQKVAVSRISTEVREMHKLYHNEFAGRLRNMQEELDKYHDIDRGRVYDDILREVARIYCDNEALLDTDADEKLKKRIKYLFMDIEQLLESNGVKIQRSVPGDKRNNKFCQIVDRVETTNPEKHDTVVCSKGTGFYTEKRPLIKELIDVYVYQSSTEADIDAAERS